MLPGFEDSLTESNILSDGVVRDGNFITAKGAGKALEFGAAIVDYFSEPQKVSAFAENAGLDYE